LKKLTTKSGHSASIKIPKCKYSDEMSFVRPYLRERDTVTNLEFDEKGETDEEELLQAKSEHDVTPEQEEQTAASEHDGTAEQEEQTAASEHDGTVEQEEQTPASAKYKLKNKIFRRTLKGPRCQPETPSAVLMKYLVEGDKERQAEPHIDPIDAFFKSIATTVKRFLLIIKTFASQEYLRLYLKWK
jgi:hypothetical protein